MKKRLLFLLFSLFVFTLSAQVAVPNPGFENWTTVGNYQDPDGWNTLNPSTAFVGILTAQKASGADAYSGSFALKLITKYVLGQNANGIATTGTIDVANQTITGGVAYTLRPDSISGWYKFTPGAGTDNGFVDFTLFDAANDTLGFVDFNTPTGSVAAYTYFSAPIVYRSSATPALSRCVLSSSAGYTSVVNSTLFLDELSLVFNPNGVKETLPTTSTFFHFNAEQGLLSVRTEVVGAKKVSLLTVNGQTVAAFEMSDVQSEFHLGSLASGIYLLSVSDAGGKLLSTGKIQVR